MSKNVLTRDMILSADDGTRPVPVDVPEWGGVVYLRALTLGDMVGMGRFKDADETSATLAMIALSLCDESGERLFDPDDTEAVEALGRKSGRVLERLASEAIRLNGLAPDQLEDGPKN